MSSEPRGAKLEQGLVQIYTGDGKGKTTAALGLVLRAAGHGLRAHIVYFMKGDPRYGAEEDKVLSLLPGVSVVRFGQADFVTMPGGRAGDREQARAALAEARRATLSGDYDLVVLDEVNVAMSLGLISADDVLALLAERPGKVELVLTGRGAPASVIQQADLVTEMVEVKHPYAKGVLARAGIDY